MERVPGIGGYFMRAADPEALAAWYRDCLGLDADENGLWHQEPGPTVFATFESGTDYFGSRAQQAMLELPGPRPGAMLAQLRAKGADVAEETQDMEGVGRFGWVTDPEGQAGPSCGSPPETALQPRIAAGRMTSAVVPALRPRCGSPACRPSPG